jgi:CheY-like chemotaxis protein
MRLLWVENHAVFVRVAGAQFLVGHALTVVPSLAAAREALAAGAFDAVLLDYDLDDGIGASLIESIRQLPTPPVVVASSAHSHGNELLLAAGADVACPKGRFAEVEAILARAIAERARARPFGTFDQRAGGAASGSMVIAHRPR